MSDADDIKLILERLESIDRSTREAFAAAENLAVAVSMHSEQLRNLNDLVGSLVTRLEMVEQAADDMQTMVALGIKRGAA